MSALRTFLALVVFALTCVGILATNQPLGMPIGVSAGVGLVGSIADYYLILGDY